MSEETNPSNDLIAELTADIVGAYVGNNAVPLAELPNLIAAVAASFRRIGQTAPAPAVKAPPKPAVPIKRSVTDDHVISLEDGNKYRTLKRHLSSLGLTPEQYRAKWGLPGDYPMIAPAYAAKRAEIARSTGLGRQPAAKPKTRGKAKS